MEELVASKRLLQWQNARVGEGEKGTADSEVCAGQGLPERAKDPRKRALATRAQRRQRQAQELKHALSNAPKDIPFKELIRVSGARWRMERCF